MTLRSWALAPLAAVLVGAAPAPDAELAASADRVRAHVEFLANDLLEGRGLGTRGHELAALYVASQFRSLGLRPGGERGGWYQRVPFRRAAHEGVPTVTLTAGGRTDKLRWASDVAVRPSLTERQRDMRSALVFAGYGIADRALGTDDFRGLNLRGKTAVVFAGTPAGLNSEVAAHLGSQKARMAAAAGAIGLIEIPVQPNGQTRLGQFAGSPAVDWVAGGTAGSTPSGLRFRMALSEQAAARLFTGARASLAQVRAQAAPRGARPTGFPLTASLTVRANSQWEDFTSPAVLGLIPGSDPRLASEYVLLTGHLDHLGIKKDAKPGEDRIYNGALDNAAGIATMVEAARAFTSAGTRPRRSVLFIAHTGEELGLLGADYWAANPTVPIGQVAAAVNLDMPVPLYPFSDVVAFGADHSTVARTVAAAGRTMNVAVSPDPMPEQSIFVRSDHYPLARRGVPAILLFTGYGSGGKPIWDKFFDERYHSVRDDLSQPILWDAAARYAQLNYRIARRLADDPQRPRWYAGSYFGEAFAPGQPKATR
ncbi:M28 family peptidase [uncultured Sphingomonas sp.]|uniref:M28 family peptidase n=1 Tax=uncultured Sphingomonas sp. TaxID=158754 RepID=UPI0025D99C22|nr:M28 family peptidase [uncultured Sphingomonas sp.]